MLDAVLLIAATAVGLAQLRTTLASPPPGSMTWPLTMRLYFQFAVAAPLMLSWTAAVAVACLVSPRPHGHLLGRRPGVVAALVGSSWGVLTLAFTCLSNWKHLGLGHIFGPNGVFLWINVHYSVPPVVIGAWVTLKLAGVWESDASWTDRGGRWLGFYWIFMYVAMWITYFLD